MQYLRWRVVTNLFEYDNSGDSFFVSKDMYTSLYQTCRCGRPKTDAHSLKCLQKVQNPYLKNDANGGKSEFLPQIPKTSLGNQILLLHDKFVDFNRKFKFGFQVCTVGPKIGLPIGNCRLVIHHQNMICQVDVLMGIRIRMFLLAEICVQREPTHLCDQSKYFQCCNSNVVLV